ncbi:phage major capsid protein [Mycolicibacterium tokaiense]|uniref:HK97 family phage prohead protease n=1 Tax=Mycolicibacterium tokaiense TaxID=39695 RepID=A0A378TGM2_9MYCO|nr:phage major capsid protein [Mycolicibacterium tokaiense]BBY86500.1 phage capsid protein [Mycolicibacterium tokaiense]STZ58995.1 HK97 family phage prohead protease [Mycolicibacterium tokaiense]
MEIFLSQLMEKRAEVTAERVAILDAAKRSGAGQLTEDEQHRFDELSGSIAALDTRIADTQAEIARAGRYDTRVQRVRQAQLNGGVGAGLTEARDWGRRAARALQVKGGESRAISSGSLDVPVLINPSITPMARPQRLIDLLVNRLPLAGNAFEYHRQTVRTNNAAPVADNALKPTSVLTLAPIVDRARVVAHLSEPVPLRLLDDVNGFEDWLSTEMAEGVLDALERQIISGDGEGENFDGITQIAGTRQVASETSLPRTLRKALTVMQNAGEQPNALVLAPDDAEALDLLRESTEGGWLMGGALSTTPGGNVLGGPTITRVVSPSMPAGLAVLGDFSRVQLHVREDVNIQIDAGGELFNKNQFRARAEGRFGVAHLRPSAFAVIDTVIG